MTQPRGFPASMTGGGASSAGSGGNRRALFLGVAVVTVLALAVGALWWTRWRGDELARFYRPPFPFTEQDPGTLVKAEPAGTRGEADVYRIMYHSRSLENEDVAVTGFVIVPRAAPPDGGRPIVAVGHPSVGIADKCAPSRDPGKASKIAIDAFLLAGWIVVQTDYEGLGPPGRHPYLVGPSQGRSIVDSVRAARQVPGAKAADRYAVWGHSQGGHAAIWSGGVAEQWAPELQLAGVVAAAPVADVAEFVNFTTFAGASVLTLTVAGYAAAYPQLDPAEILTEQGQSHLTDADEKCLGDLGKAIGDTPINELRGVDPTTTEPWAGVLADNAAARAGGTVPILLLQGDDDPIIPAENTVALFDQLCEQGRTTGLISVPGGNHGTVVDETVGQFTEWISERLAGVPAGSDCG